MIAYKGFEPQPDGTLKCRDKTYREGETYTEPEAVICKSGMHACLVPIDVLAYYPPATSVYHEVEVGDDAKGEPGGDSKVTTKTLTVRGHLGIPGLVKTQIDYTVSRATVEPGGHATGDRGAASATGDRGAASATGYQGAASATGYQGAASATGYQGAASATGYRGAASATGDRGAASVEGKDAIALAGGWKCRAKGMDGAWLGLVERAHDRPTGRTPMVGKPAWVQVGSKHKGRLIKPDVYYGLVGGVVVEVDEDGEPVR